MYDATAFTKCVVCFRVQILLINECKVTRYDFDELYLIKIENIAYIFSIYFLNQHYNDSVVIIQRAQKVAQSLNRHIDATVPDKIKQISPTCSQSYCE